VGDLGRVSAIALMLLGGLVVLVAPASAVTEPGGPTVLVGCLGVDPGPTGPQIRVGIVTSGPDGLYRAVFAGPAGPVQGEGRVAGGRGLVIVPSTGPGDYGDLVLTDVDTGQSVDRGPLGDELPFAVGEEAVTCDPAALVVPNGESTPPTAPPTESTVAPTPDPTGVPTPDISTASPVPATTATSASTSDTPPWLLLVIPGVLLAGGGVFLLLKGRSDSRSRPAT
jgi:hypothetical protein